MQRHAPCPGCGASVYLTDAQCQSCGLELDEGRSAELASAPPVAPPAPLAGPPAVRAGARPWTITLVVIVADVLAALTGLAGIVLFLMALAALAAGYAEGRSLGFALAVIAGLLLLAPATILVSTFVWRGFSWAYWTFFPLLALQAVLGIAEMKYHALSHALGMVTTIVSVLLLAVLCSPSAKAFCRR